MKCPLLGEGWVYEFGNVPNCHKHKKEFNFKVCYLLKVKFGQSPKHGYIRVIYLFWGSLSVHLKKHD